MPSALHEAVIIGGGPAGCAAAIGLANAGKPVCLLERKTAAHDKVCGEFISHEAAQSLTLLGLDVASLGAQPVYKLRLYNGDDVVSCNLPDPAWSLSRCVLDACLLKRALAVGVDVRTGVVAREMHRTMNGWDLIISNCNGFSDERRSGRLQADTIFLASGKQDMRNWQRQSPSAAHGELIGLKIHLHLDPIQQERLKHTVEVYFYNSGYAGLEPIEDGKANLCLLIHRNVYKSCSGYWPHLMDWLCNFSPQLKVRLDGSRVIWPKPLAISGVPYGYIYSAQNVDPDLFRLGDQAAVIHSLAGDGIAMALHSALLAARTYVAGGKSESYYRQVQQDFQKPIRNAQILAGLLSNSMGRKTLFFLSASCPALLGAAISGFRLKNY